MSALAILVNFLACCGIGWACYCRLVVIDDTIQPRVRWQFLAKFAGATVAGWVPLLWPQHIEWAILCLSGALFVSMLLGVARWRRGPPRDTKTIPGDLQP